MNKKHIIFIFRAAISVFLAVHVWLWLRYAGIFWALDYPDVMDDMVKSVYPLKESLTAFAIVFFPALVMGFFVHANFTVSLRLLASAIVGATFSTMFLIFIARFNLTFIVMRMWVYLAAGGAAGLVYAAIMEVPWGARHASDDEVTVSQTRRKLLGSLGLSVGAVGALGSLSGPFYFWLNRNNYIDVNVDHLREGEMIEVKLASRPVWIIKRTPDVIRLLRQDNLRLRDPGSAFSKQPEQAKNALRSIRPEYFVVYGVCTHLGCAPSYEPGGRDDEAPFTTNTLPQFFCLCHGGIFDLAGRVYKNTPPPVNMVVPFHEFVSDDVIRLYFPSLTEEWNS